MPRAALALEATGTLTKVDAENGRVIVFANGEDRNLKIAENVKVFGTDGKPLPAGIKSTALQPGTAVTITVEFEGGGPTLKVLRLGTASAGTASPDAANKEGKPSVGIKPLTDMTDEWYKGEDGGLYGGGRNDPPPTLMALARVETARVVPLDDRGKPSREGKIGLVSLSMSNATMEYSAFKQLADADPDKSPDVAIVDCAQGGQAMAQWIDPPRLFRTSANRSSIQHCQASVFGVVQRLEPDRVPAAIYLGRRSPRRRESTAVSGVN